MLMNLFSLVLNGNVFKLLANRSAFIIFCNCVFSLSCVFDDLLVTLKDGRLELLFWEDPLNKRKSISLGNILFSVDMQLAGSCFKTFGIFNELFFL